MLHIRKLFFTSVLFVVVLGFSGCIPLIIGAAAGAGGYAFAKGVVVKELSATTDKLHNAALKTFGDMDILVTGETQDTHNSKIVGKTSMGTKVTVEIKAMTERVAQIKIRHGLIGDEEQSRIILNAITKKL